MKHVIAVIAASILAAAGSVAYAQEQAGGDKFVSKEDYQKLKSAHEKLQQDMDALKAQMQELQKKGSPQQAETEQAIDELDKEIKKVKSLAEAARPGENKFLLAGYGFAGYSDKKEAVSSFTAGFNPVFLYKATDRLFYEAELEVELADDAAEFDIEYMQLAYVLNDYVTFGAGKFLSPNNYFMERQHIAYINKLPTFPDFIEGDTRLQAHTQLGFQARGAAPVGPTTLNYAVYVANGPRLRTAGGSAGTLKFKNFDDNNNNKAVGGRIGFLPVPQLDIGYGFEVAEVGTAGGPFSDLQAVSHAIDLSYVRASEFLKGTVDLRTQLVWLDIDNPNVAPLIFNNNRRGGYAQFAYRPSKLEAPIIKDLEGVVRYDWLDLPKAAPTPNNFDSSNWTLGLNYWLTSHTVLKAAYQFGDQKDPAGLKKNTDAFLIQIAHGF